MGKKKREKKLRSEQAKLTKYCGENLNMFCDDTTSLHDMKQCLAMNYGELETDCAEYLIGSSEENYHSDGGHRFHKRILKLAAFIVGFLLLMVLLCVCRKRCRHRRQWRNMLAARLNSPQNYIAVPTTPSSPSQSIQMTPLPTAPQNIQPTNVMQSQPSQPSYSQNVVFASASPYTGNIPVTAVPIAYNPQAMSIA